MAYNPVLPSSSSSICHQCHIEEGISWARKAESKRVLPPINSWRRSRRRDAATMAMASGNDGIRPPTEMRGFLGRRAMAVLIAGTFHWSSLHPARADQGTLTESEQLRQEMLREIDNRIKAEKKDSSISKVALQQTEVIEDTLTSSPESSVAPIFVQDSSSSPTPAVEISSSMAESTGFIGYLGIAGSGVLGVLYWLERRAKESSELTLQEARSNLKAKEDAFRALKEESERIIAEEEEKALKQLQKAQEENSVLLGDLAMVKEDVESLRGRLVEKKNVAKSLEMRVGTLQLESVEAERQNGILEEKFNAEKEKGKSLEEDLKGARLQISTKEGEIGQLNALLQEKERLLEGLSIKLEKVSEELTLMRSQVEELELGMVAANGILKEKEEELKDLDRKNTLALAEGEETRTQLVNVQKELENLRMSSQRDIEMLKKSLGSKEVEVEQLGIRLVEISNEAENRSVIIANMEQEIDSLKHEASQQMKDAEKLAEEMQAIVSELGDSKMQVVLLSKEVAESKESMKELLRIRVETEEHVRSLHCALSEEQATVCRLQEETEARKQELDASTTEILSLRRELTNLEFSNEKLKQDIVLNKEALEVTTAAFMEEKERAATNLNQLESSRKIINDAKETLKILREDVGKVGDELQEANKEVSILSKQLGEMESKVATLEAEKLVLNEALSKERDLSTGLMNKASQVDAVLKKLGKEKEISQKRGKKLEQKLAATREEMDYLRRQLSVTNSALQEAKSRIKTVEENTQFEVQSRQAMEVRSKMESVEAELSRVGEILEDAKEYEAEAEVAIKCLQSTMQSELESEDAVISSQVSSRDREA